MATKRTLSEAETLEQYRVALENTENQTEIATIMADFGYDETLLTEGKILLTKTREAFDSNQKEDDENKGRQDKRKKKKKQRRCSPFMSVL